MERERKREKLYITSGTERRGQIVGADGSDGTCGLLLGAEQEGALVQ